MAFAGYFTGEAGGFGPGKMKRKGVENVSEEFSEFSLSAPARKIRRLDVGLPPIIEEEESAAFFNFGEVEGNIAKFAGATEAEPPIPVNEERALVLYMPVTSLSAESSLLSSNVSFRVSPDLISDFRDHFYRSQLAKAEEDFTTEDDKAASVSSSMAVVPWVPSQLSGAFSEVGINSIDEQMELEEYASMDVEEEQQPEFGGNGRGGIVASGLQQWQPHCMTPQAQAPASSYAPTPVMWFR